MAVWKPSARECELIRQAAAREAELKVGAVRLQPGCRGNTKDDAKNESACKVDRGDYNIALVSDDPDWDDTDLCEYGTWAEFRKGVGLTSDGRAIVDFYISARTDEDLHGNVVVIYENGAIARIHGFPGEYPVR